MQHNIVSPIAQRYFGIASNEKIKTQKCTLEIKH